MKTSFVQIVINYLKKNYKYVVLILLVIGAVSYIGFRENFIVNQTKKMDKLVYENSALTLDRQFLEQKIGRLQKQNDSIQRRNDSLRSSLTIMKAELKQMEIEHKHIIDSLMNVPDDTVYVRLQPLYPNIDASPLIYPFSGSQIRQIYSTAISYPLLTQQYLLQGKALGTCTELNNGYEASIKNLNGQIALLQEDISKCDNQVGNYKKEVVLLNKQVGRSNFLKRVFQTTTGILGLIAILK